MSREVPTEYLVKFTQIMVTQFPDYKLPLTDRLAQALHDEVCGSLPGNLELKALLIPEIGIFRQKYPELVGMASIIDPVLKARLNCVFNDRKRRGQRILNIRETDKPGLTLYGGRRPINGRYGPEITGDRFLHIMLSPYIPN